ncbi:unnamed protein product [marine sediment metagenome]|uniref:Uncharacterized protein n=1 Tax=marine sediment metagenome TaxID=412755 RepID=X1QJX5_9ZZZZ
MEEERDSKEYSWRWVTASELLSHGACELLFVLLTSPDDISDCTLYDGETNLGRTIVKLEGSANRSFPFLPAKPIYCRRGLYVEKGTRMTGVLIQWRELGHRGSGG